MRIVVPSNRCPRPCWAAPAVFLLTATVTPTLADVVKAAEKAQARQAQEDPRRPTRKTASPRVAKV